jgi:glycosyltransferase involved in cell wall biosynthesis
VRPSLISVITPSLNQGRFIENAILSVASQGYPNFEHIVVDGGSTDETLTILKRYPHIRWVSEPDYGQSDGINKGFRMAMGDLVGWLNADDYYLPGALQAIGQFAASQPEADIVYGDCIHVDEHGNLLRFKGEHSFDFNVLLYWGCYIDSNTTFLRRRVIDEGLLLDVEYRVVMDYEYFVRLAAKGKAYNYLGRPLAAFRWHGANNNSLQVEKGRKERLRIQQTWSRRKLAPTGYHALARLYRAKRVWLKLLEGTYWAELKTQRLRGRSTCWFNSDEGHPECTSLLFSRTRHTPPRECDRRRHSGEHI